jgi:hypothetical protein
MGLFTGSEPVLIIGSEPLPSFLFLVWLPRSASNFVLFCVLMLAARGAGGPIWPSDALRAVAAVFICDVPEPGCSGVMLNRSVSDLRGGSVELDRRLIGEGGPERIPGDIPKSCGEIDKMENASLAVRIYVRSA